MPEYRYTGMDARGRESSGKITAESRARAITQIKERGLFPTSVDELSGNGRAPAPRGRAAPAKRGGLNTELRLPGFLGELFKARVKPRNLAIFTRQLAITLDAGLPLLRSLQTLLRQEKHPSLRESLHGLSESVESGSTFSEALAQYPKIFDKLFVNMVKAGEAGGILDGILARLADFMEKGERIRNKVRGAMVYPVVVLVLALTILSGLMIFIIPRFEKIFTDLLGDKPLPGLTRVVISVSEFMRDGWLIIVIAVVVIGVGVKLIKRTQKGAAFFDGVILRAPLFGVLMRKAAIARFARTLGTLLSSGVPILQALTIVRETAGNEVIARCISSVHDSVKEGDTMADPMAATGGFPDIVVSMVDVGEETGALPEMLIKVADAFDDEVDTTVEGLTSIIEPIMIIFLALMVGVIVISMFMPLIGIIDAMVSQG